jgi:sugar phosphate isomerase/epimerase
MAGRDIPRRTFLTVTGASAVGLAFDAPGAARLIHATDRGPDPRAAPAPVPTFALGVASYSLRKFPRSQAIEMVRALGTPYVNFKSVHLPYESSPQELAAARREIEAAGLRITGGGTITFEEDSDAGVEQYFAYAQHAGMPLIVATADPAILPRIERFARRYDIEVAIHNHGPEDRWFPSPYDALKHVRRMDRRMGLCIDLGHTVRTGTDVVQAVADAGTRLLDMHVKDLRDLKVKETQCIVGEGAIPIAEVFQQLHAMGYGGYANLEYEIDADDPLPGMQRSFAYMRGVLTGLATAGPRVRRGARS